VIKNILTRCKCHNLNVKIFVILKINQSLNKIIHLINKKVMKSTLFISNVLNAKLFIVNPALKNILSLSTNLISTIIPYKSQSHVKLFANNVSKTIRESFAKIVSNIFVINVLLRYITKEKGLSINYSVIKFLLKYKNFIFLMKLKPSKTLKYTLTNSLLKNVSLYMALKGQILFKIIKVFKLKI
jgi:hypothetical protein